MKYGLVIYGEIKKPSDWKILNESVDRWKSDRLKNGSSFLITVCIAFKNNVLDSSFVDQIEKKIDGSFNVLLSSLDYQKFSFENIKKCLSTGLKRCREAGTMNSMIMDYRFSSREHGPLVEKGELCCLSLYEEKSTDFKMLSPIFMCGKTKTLERVWDNVPAISSLNIEENTFRAFANVAGKDLMLMKVVSRQSINLRKRIS